eukprot:scaffold7515_cov34-Prasinocladus_malaysianus.AAC.1
MTFNRSDGRGLCRVFRRQVPLGRADCIARLLTCSVARDGRFIGQVAMQRLLKQVLLVPWTVHGYQPKVWFPTHQAETKCRIYLQNNRQ